MSLGTLKATGSRQSLDLAQVRRALAVLVDPAHGVELRGLPTGRSRVVIGSDLDELCRAANELADSNGIYYALNPVPVGAEHATAANVIHRRWMLVDVDPVKADKDNSATDGEKAAAGEAQARIMAYLEESGWPPPVLIDSGNGWHLLYRIDLPNDAQAAAVVKRVLYALANEFDTEAAQVDRAVHNASRIAKLPGTWARKGKDIDDRPFRMCRMVYCPETIEVVTIEQLQAVGAAVSPAAATTPLPAQTHHASPQINGLRVLVEGNNARYARRAMDGEIMRIILAKPGERNNAVNRAAFSLSQLVAGGLLQDGEVRNALYQAACRAGLDVDPGCGPKGIHATITSGMLAGAKEPRGIPETNGNGHAPKPPPPPPPEGVPLTVCAADIKPMKVSWLWPNRIPVDFITVFAGRTGLGKSFVTCDVVARITTGGAIPFGDGECFAEGGALFVSEDPPEYMLVPRLIELGTDLSRVRFLSWEAMASYTLADTDYLDRACQEVGELKVVIIDPPTNFLGATDEHKNAEVRGALMRLVTWLKGRGVACILIMHVNKQVGKGFEAINRVLGSVAWVSTSRVAHSFAPDPEGGDRCLFVPMKNNLGPLSKALAYRISPTAELAKVEWDSELDVTADQAMGQESRPRAQSAAAWLLEKFDEKLEWPSDELFRAATGAGISRNAVFEAKSKLSLPKARKVTHENGDMVWVWWVPPDFPGLSQGRRETLGTLGTVQQESF